MEEGKRLGGKMWASNIWFAYCAILTVTYGAGPKLINLLRRFIVAITESTAMEASEHRSPALKAGFLASTMNGTELLL